MDGHLSAILQVILVVLLVRPVGAQVDTTRSADEERVYELAPVIVTAEQSRWGEQQLDLGREAVQRVLSRAGVGLIRRGDLLASDVYLDGFKRGDVALVIDGERYPNSCPNRMDAPLTRVNPLEVGAVRVDKSSSGPQAGLGGILSYRRSEPAHAWNVRTGVTQEAGSVGGTDVALAVERLGHRATGRFMSSLPYRDGEGQTYAARYGYRASDFRYRLGEISAHGAMGAWTYGGTVSITRDVPFPYLHMDERENDLYSAFASFHGHKVYVNRTYHLMDRGLRRSPMGMTMESEAENLTIGVSGDQYEAYYRSWSVWNMRSNLPSSSSSSSVMQHMVPDVRELSAAVRHDLRAWRAVIAMKLGIRRVEAADHGRLPDYRLLYPEAPIVRWFLPFSLTTSYDGLLTPHVTGGVQLEVASAAPQAEHLYISLKRPGEKPRWTGNPTLDFPLRASLRSVFTTEGVRAELFANALRDYPVLTPVVQGQLRHVTYRNVNAAMAGVTMRAGWAWADAEASYTWAHNLSDDVPLAEIAPLSASATLYTPAYGGLDGYLRFAAAAAQHRVDRRLSEEETPGWMRLDAGVAFDAGVVTVALEVENVADVLYHRHLSYLRDPFASGLRIYEPGRVVRVSLRTSLGEAPPAPTTHK